MSKDTHYSTPNLGPDVSAFRVSLKIRLDSELKKADFKTLFMLH